MTRKSLRELEQLLRELDGEVGIRVSDSDPGPHHKTAIEIHEAVDHIEEKHGLDVDADTLTDAIIAAAHQRLRSDGGVPLKRAVVDVILDTHGE